MAEGETRSGLLSKVAKFVRNPTKDWSELDQKDPEPDSGYSKEALKEMIERKRQNDFVRRREFDHLRKLRRRDPLSSGDSAGRPSFFQSSLTSNHDDRAQTLKKIDEIEAQMSRQWWKGKQGDEGLTRAGNFPVAAPAARPEAAATEMPKLDRSEISTSSKLPEHSVHASAADTFETTEASVLRSRSSQWHDSPAELMPSGLNDPGPTIPSLMAQGATQPPPSRMRVANRQPPPPPPPPQGPSASSYMPLGAGFTTQRLYASVPADSLTDPDLEESAIRFANGDDAGAEQSLLAVLENAGSRPELAEAWLSALFDLYRATGQQDRFDSVGIDFANRFGRSPPAWFSTPDQLGHGRPTASARRAPALATEPDWVSPPQLDAASLQALQEVCRVAGPLLIDWTPLSLIGPDAVPVLARIVADWSAKPATLVFRNHGRLEHALQDMTPSGDRTVDPVCWQLRMDALRIMRLQDAFELVALDYCVTYEVSPPSWHEPVGKCTLESESTSPAEEVERRPSSWDKPSSGLDELALNLTVAAGLEGEPPAIVELTGEILGDAAEALARLEAGTEGATRMVISCARLIRVDFPAAGSILNWVAEQQANGCQVQFREVNRLVAAFFTVIGINEHARVFPRSA